MPRIKVLVKVSGDLCSQEKVLAWIEKLALNKKYFIVICVGGGTQINRAFEAADFPVGKHGPLGRSTNEFKQRQLARDILELNQEIVQDKLAERGIQAAVVIPAIEIGTVLCHVNGDIFLLTAYHGFEQLYVLTTKQRESKKKKDFRDYPKIEVVAF